MKRALVSVSDKTGLVEFVSGLVEQGYEIISTGGTKKALEKAGLNIHIKHKKGENRLKCHKKDIVVYMQCLL